MTSCLFAASLSQNFDINHVIVEIVSSVFNVYFFDISHLYV